MDPLSGVPTIPTAHHTSVEQRLVMGGISTHSRALTAGIFPREPCHTKQLSTWDLALGIARWRAGSPPGCGGKADHTHMDRLPRTFQKTMSNVRFFPPLIAWLFPSCTFGHQVTECVRSRRFCSNLSPHGIRKWLACAASDVKLIHVT